MARMYLFPSKLRVEPIYCQFTLSVVSVSLWCLLGICCTARLCLGLLASG